MSVQIEGVYTQALLDTGGQVTLLYRDFYDRHLSHIPIRKLEELEIWGIGTTRCPYDGYIPIQISFGPVAVGKEETFDTLVVVCPRPPGAGRNSILVGTNTDLVRRLLFAVLDTKGVTPTRSTHNYNKPTVK